MLSENYSCYIFAGPGINLSLFNLPISTAGSESGHSVVVLFFLKQTKKPPKPLFPTY